VWVCHHYLPELAALNSNQLLCVPGNVGIGGSETVNQGAGKVPHIHAVPVLALDHRLSLLTVDKRLISGPETP